MRLYGYTARVTALNGATIVLLAQASSAMAALRNVQRARRGDWTRIEVGIGAGDSFRMLQETSR